MNIGRAIKLFIFKLIIKFIRKFENNKRKNKCEERFDYLRKNKNIILNSGITGYKIKADQSNLLKKANFKNITDNHNVGAIDQDGFILPEVEGVQGVPSIKNTKFMERERFGVSIVVRNGYLAIKKEYAQKKYAFIKEIDALYQAFTSGCNVPQILDIDFENLILTISYIEGKVLREELAQKGAVIRDSQVGKSSDFSYFKKNKIANMRIEEGKKFLYEVIGSDFVEEVMNQYTKLHSCGVVNNDIKYGNIIIEKHSKKPYIIDFETAWVFHNPQSKSAKLLAEQDKRILKKHFK